VIDPIDDELREYVDAYKDLERPTDAARAATWAGIDARLADDLAPVPLARATTSAGSDPRLADDLAPVPLARARRPAAIAAIAAALALCFGLAAAAVWRGRIAVDHEASHHASDPATTPIRPASIDRAAPLLPTSTPRDSSAPLTPSDPTSTPRAPIDPTTTPIDPASLTPSPNSTVPRDRPTPRPSTRRRPSVPEQPSLRPEEVASFRRAQAALADGDSELALRALDEHGRRYPGGFFEEERLVSRAAALCELGRVDAARSVRDEFLRERPASHLRERMRQTCRDFE
jgi:hypothetical protein